MKYRVTRMLALAAVVAMVAGVGAVARAASAGTFEGTLAFVSGDNAEFNQHLEQYFLATAEGTNKRVIPVSEAAFEEPARKLDKKTVIVEGIEDGDTIRATKVRKKATDGPQASALSAALTGSQKFVAVLCKFADIATEPHPQSYYSGLQNGDSYPGQDHYWVNQSYNNINLAGSFVTTWVTLPKNRSQYFDGFGDALLDSLITDCTAAADSQVNYPSYVGINTFYNATLDCCAWGGSMTLTRDGQTKSYRATWMPPWGAEHGVFGHEMGHAFGFPHSSGPYSATYDSQWDIMSDPYNNLTDPTYGAVGSGTIAYHRDLDGWIPASRKFTPAVSTSTTIKLWPLGSPAPTTGSSYQMAQIPISGTTQFFTLEARRQSGYDGNGTSGIPDEGVVIHYVDTARSDRVAQVIDASNNNNPNDAGAIWTPGELYIHPPLGVKVEVLSENLDGTFNVRIGYKLDAVTVIGAPTNVTEGGATDTYSMWLDTPPTANVTVTLTRSNTEATLSASTLTFTPTNFGTAQTVTVTAVNDADPEGTHTMNISHSTSSADLGYNGLSVPSVLVTITDNDGAVQLVQSGGATAVAEGGATDSYTLVLASRPTANVTVTNATTSGDITRSVSSNTFTPINWATPQTVTITAVNDSIDEPSPEIATITHTTSSADAAYNALLISNVLVSVTDNDVVGITLTQTSGTTQVTEAGLTDSYTFVLTSQPLANVTITATAPAGQMTLSATSLIFTAANWSTPQSITVTAINDSVDEASPMTQVIAHAVTSGDTSYNAFPTGSVAVSVIDDDVAGIVLTQSGGTTSVTEGGGGDSYSLVLTSQPTGSVTINAGVSPSGQVVATGASLTFTASNWNVAQSLGYAAVNDLIDEVSPMTVTVTHAPSSTDSAYNSFPIGSVAISVIDNDIAGVSVVPSGGSTNVSEGGTTDSFTVVLTSQPVSTVSVSFTDPSGQVMSAPSPVTFNATNWNTAQTVTVTAIDDTIEEASPHATSIGVGVSSSDSFYSGIGVPSVLVSITDNDDRTAPVSSFTTGNGAILVGGVSTINGRTADSISPVSGVVVTMTPTTGPASTFTPSLSCTNAGKDCTWSITLPVTMLPGIYSVNARGTDNRGNAENPGASISAYVV